MAKRTHGETDESWPHVLAVSPDDKLRLIVSNDTPPAMQWIVQRRLSSIRWTNRSFCQTKKGLRLVAPIFVAVIEALPDVCPQIPHPKRLPSDWGTMATGEPDLGPGH